MDTIEIWCGCHLLRSRLNTSRLTTRKGYDDEKIKNTFGAMSKTCTTLFAKFISPVSATKKFEIPDWIPILPLPNSQFESSPPSYKGITKVVRRIKATGSPCPLCQLSRIPFKRCPYLRDMKSLWVNTNFHYQRRISNYCYLCS